MMNKLYASRRRKNSITMVLSLAATAFGLGWLVLILRVLPSGPLHGYAIAQRIAQSSRDELSVEEGSLYPALYRMERRGWIDAAWGKSDVGQRIKIYSLTAQGRAQLRAESAQWSHFTAAVAKVMGTS